MVITLSDDKILEGVQTQKFIWYPEIEMVSWSIHTAYKIYKVQIFDNESLN